MVSFVLRTRLERVVFLLWFVAGVSSFSIVFPTSPPAATTISVAWSRDQNEPNIQFYFQKIKLDEPGGPTVKSTPVAVTISDQNEGFSPIFFSRAGVFEILAVNIQNEQPFYTTEVTVATNPTSTGGPSTSVTTPSIPTDHSFLGRSSRLKKIATNPITTASCSTSVASTTSTGAGTKQSQRFVMIIVISTGIVIGFIVVIAMLVWCIRYQRHRQLHSKDRVPIRLAVWLRRLSRAGHKTNDVESHWCFGTRDRPLVVNPYNLNNDASTEQQEPSANGISVPQVETNAVRRSSQAISSIESRTTSIQSFALTERQVQIQEEAGHLREQVLELGSAEDSSLREMMGQLIERMRVLEARADSDWARGLTDEPPPDYFSQDGSVPLTLRHRDSVVH